MSIIYPLFPCSDFVSQMWGWFFLGGGGGISYFMLFATSLEQNLGIQKILFFFEKNNYFSFNVFFMFFFMLEILKSAPSLTIAYWLNERWFLQIVDIGNFNMRLEILKSAPSLTG